MGMKTVGNKHFTKGSTLTLRVDDFDSMDVFPTNQYMNGRKCPMARALIREGYTSMDYIVSDLPTVKGAWLRLKEGETEALIQT